MTILYPQHMTIPMNTVCHSQLIYGCIQTQHQHIKSKQKIDQDIKKLSQVKNHLKHNRFNHQSQNKKNGNQINTILRKLSVTIYDSVSIQLFKEHTYRTGHQLQSNMSVRSVLNTQTWININLCNLTTNTKKFL